MAPIDINNQNVDSVEVNGQSVDEITVDGDVVFSAVPPTLPNPVDNFESGNLSAYQLDTQDFTVQSNDVFDGSFALSTISGSSARIFTNNPPGGNNITFGTDFEWYFYSADTQDFQVAFTYESSGQRAQGKNSDGYHCRVEQDSMAISRSTPGDFDGASGRSDTSISPVRNRWYKVQTTFSGSTATYTLIDTTNNSTLASLSHGQFSTLGSGIAIQSEVPGVVRFDELHLL
jgi:hypothetical protein